MTFLLILLRDSFGVNEFRLFSFFKYNSDNSQKYATIQNDILIRKIFMQFICHRKLHLDQVHYKIL